MPWCTGPALWSCSRSSGCGFTPTRAGPPGWRASRSLSAGLLVRRERDLVAQLREAQAGLAERARSEERNRIARELHDVIAHTLTVSLLHVTQRSAGRGA